MKLTRNNKIDDKLYVAHKTGRECYRNWFFVKCKTNLTETKQYGYVEGLRLILPERYIGKKIRLKLEEINDEE